MKISAYFCFCLAILQMVNCFIEGAFGVNVLERLLGEGSFVLRAFYVAVGVAACFFVSFVWICNPFRDLK